MKYVNLRLWPQALAVAGMMSSLSAVTAFGAAGDNGQYFMLEGLYLVKDDADAIALTTSNGGGAFNLITSDVAELDDSGGLRITAQFDAFGHTWQASAFGVRFDDQQFLATNLDFGGVGGNNTSTTYGEFSGTANSQQLHALELSKEGDLWGAEANWVRHLAGPAEGIDLLIGVRYIHFGEDLSGVAYDEANDFSGVDNGIDRFNIGVDNDLVGLQVGLQGMWDLGSHVAVGGSIKGGLAANFASRDRAFGSDNSNVFDYANSIDDTGFAQFVEVNPRIDLKLSENATITVAGTALWINETTRADSHFETVANGADANIRDDDDELVYGASIGLKLALN
ncbi:MAG: hypothetical protein HOP13_15785 [Alphaproteobacteria bacterium]|nr:hypothetical protein [Alphaproteobacteria bacterium]